MRYILYIILIVCIAVTYCKSEKRDRDQQRQTTHHYTLILDLYQRSGVPLDSPHPPIKRPAPIMGKGQKEAK